MRRPSRPVCVRARMRNNVLFVRDARREGGRNVYVHSRLFSFAKCNIVLIGPRHLLLPAAPSRVTPPPLLLRPRSSCAF